MNGTRTLAVAVAAALAAGALAFAASPRARSFSSGVHGISAEAPPGWTLSTHTGYPSILVLFLHTDGCRISLAASGTDAPDLRTLVEQNRKGLEAQKLQVTRVAPGAIGSVELLARAPARDELLRQAYFLRPFKEGRQAVVVTLTCKDSDIETRGRAFDLVLKRLRLDDPTPAAVVAPDGGGIGD